ncbi:MAG: uracil-DNA glycosylase [Candidatus Nanohaloarchaea archaeon]
MDFRSEFADALDEVPDAFMDGDRFVPATGRLDADVVLVGEAPGANEVEQGEPFVGRAGEQLDRILEDAGIDRDEIYITNLVKVRPPDNRDPHRDEIEAWRPVLEAEIARVDPETVVPLGNFASRELLDTTKGISQIHGRQYTVDGRTIMPTYHPAATLYDRDKTSDLVHDLLAAFGETPGGQTSLQDL